MDGERASAMIERLPRARGPNSMRLWNQSALLSARSLAARSIVLDEAAPDAIVVQPFLVKNFAEPPAVIGMPLGNDDPRQIDQSCRVGTHAAISMLLRHSARGRRCSPVRPLVARNADIWIATVLRIERYERRALSRRKRLFTSPVGYPQI